MLANFKKWASQPFSADMDVFHWFLFLGLLICIMILWNMVLRQLQDI